MKAKLLFVLLLLVFVMLAACAPAPTPAPTAAPPTAASKATEAPKPTTAPATTAATVAPTGAAAATKPPAPTNTPTATPRPPAATAAPGAVRVQFWHHLTATEQVDMIQRFADEFNAKNPQYYIIPTQQGNTSDLPKKVNAAITANAVPDMVTGNPGDLLDYNTAGVMVALDQYIKDAKDGLDAGLLAEMSYKLSNGQELFFDLTPDGKTMGVSVARSMYVLLYNVDMLKAAGFDKPPATWDDFDKICAAVTKGDTYCYPAVSAGDSWGASTFASFVYSRGGNYASADEKKAVFDEPAGVETLKWLKNLADKGWAKIPTVTPRGDQADFGNGKCAFTVATTAGLPFFADIVNARKEGPFKWDAAPLPAGPKGKPIVDMMGPSIGIMKTSAEKQKGAWLFLKYILQKENQAEWAQRLSYYPAAKSARDLVLGMDPAKLQATNARLALAFAQFKTAAGFITPAMAMREPISPAWQGMRATTVTMMTAVFTGKTSTDFTATDPEAAAKEGVQRVQKQLDAYGK